MSKVLVDLRVDDDGLRRLKACPDTDVVLIDRPDENARRPFPLRVLENVEILACTFPPSNLEDLKSLRYLQIASAGFAQVVGLGLSQRGVQVCNALGVFDVPIAEWNVAMMIDLLRDLPGMLRNQERCIWDRDSRFQRELRGLTVGIWGYGGIGRETARLTKALGMRLHVMTRAGVKERSNVYRVPGTGDPQGTLPDRVFCLERREEFLGELDFLVLSLPLTQSNEGIVGEDELRALRPSAYVLNPARGPLVRESALLRALREGWIAGAALDTHYRYPMPPDHPLWRMPNVIMTPHVSGSSGSSFYLQRVWDIFAQNVERFQKGRPLLNELSSSKLIGYPENIKENPK